VGGERDTSINRSEAISSMTEFREVKSTDDRVGFEVKTQLDEDRTHTNSEVGGGEKQLKDKWAVEFDKDRTHTNSEVGGGEKQLKNKWAVEFKEDKTITLIEVRGKKSAEAQAEIGAEEAISIKISISKSENLTIELQTLTDGAASITATKKKKSSSSTTVIEVGGEMRMKMAHADAASMTKFSEVRSRAKRITDDADWLAKIERGRRILERYRVRTDKVAKSA